jgi:hypothetical protein
VAISAADLLRTPFRRSWAGRALLDGQLLLVFALAALALSTFSETAGLYRRSTATKRLTEFVALAGFVLVVVYVYTGRRFLVPRSPTSENGTWR